MAAKASKEAQEPKLVLWLKTLKLSRPVRDLGRDFSDGGAMGCTWPECNHILSSLFPLLPHSAHGRSAAPLLPEDGQPAGLQRQDRCQQLADAEP